MRQPTGAYGVPVAKLVHIVITPEFRHGWPQVIALPSWVHRTCLDSAYLYAYPACRLAWNASHLSSDDCVLSLSRGRLDDVWDAAHNDTHNG
jgi:hypothetical protein